MFQLKMFQVNGCFLRTMNSYGNHGANPSRKATIQVYHDTLSAKIGLSLVVQKMNTISKTTIFNVFRFSGLSGRSDSIWCTSLKSSRQNRKPNHERQHDREQQQMATDSEENRRIPGRKTRCGNTIFCNRKRLMQDAMPLRVAMVLQTSKCVF